MSEPQEVIRQEKALCLFLDVLSGGVKDKGILSADTRQVKYDLLQHILIVARFLNKQKDVDMHDVFMYP